MVEVACHGGRGRTGTALAALAVLDGMPANRAVRWIRENYDPKAVENTLAGLVGARISRRRL